MLQNQAHLFSLEQGHTYLNGAYMSPQLKSVEAVGIESLKGKSRPYSITGEDFFAGRKRLRVKFAELVDISDYQQTAIIPSVSYGIACVTNNVQLDKGDEILVVDEQFPSHIYSWQKLAEKYDATIKIVKSPAIREGRGKQWNEAILDAINDKTAIVALPHVHWADGTLFDLVSIRSKATAVGAKLIIDGTQSIGALAFSVKEIQPDALIVGGYKWMLGPYSLGMAYFHESFNDGSPIEENWINRKNSEDFSNLTNYQADYQPGADRYSMGESSNFNHNPMLTKAIEQLLDWGQDDIQSYCKSITDRGIEMLRSKGCFVEAEAYRSKHLLGVFLPSNVDKNAIKQRLIENNIYVSYRGAAIRVSPNVYNSEGEFLKFVDCIY
ncbi:MAG: selenocysteine lyase/cysteine desulfurase [Saprospiraceae bacterium]|jgi:selenocysteine lyase/cysteine desulfurase|tara:strand:+ start:3972 stop:5117 length:1146 start_codon:yes stop_codon:yes gene_type:complete